MSVEQNLGFGLKLRKAPKDEIKRRVTEAAKILGLEPLLARKPAALSGGQRQRVAMGRAMVREPKAFLMDEPLSNLDAKLRVQMRAQLAKLHDTLKTTTVYVTHDQVEAMTLGERVAVMRDGVLQQVDTPQNLYGNPANLFVAAFIGSPPMNLVEANVSDGRVAFAGFEISMPDGRDLGDHRGRTLILGIRPSDLEDAAVWSNAELPTIEVTADVTEELGSEVNVLFTVDAAPVGVEEVMEAADEPMEEAVFLLEENRAVFCARVDARTHARPGARVRLSVDPRRFHFFDPETGLAIGGSKPATAPA
jgi:multiple sugar transport system ATP-binding protein